MVGYSSEYEQREAARFAGYKYLEFLQLPRFEQASIIAHYRTHGVLEAAVVVAQTSR